MAFGDQETSLERVRQDRRRSSPGNMTAYKTEQGTPVSWEGDEDAPYVKIIGDIPQPARARDLLISVSSGNELSRIVAAPCRTYRLQAYNSTGGTLFLGLFNGTTTPSLGAVPIFPMIPVPTLQYANMDLGIELSASLSTGAVLIFSSTQPTFTTPGGTPGTYGIWYELIT